MSLEVSELERTIEVLEGKLPKDSQERIDKRAAEALREDGEIWPPPMPQKTGIMPNILANTSYEKTGRIGGYLADELRYWCWEAAKIRECTSRERLKDSYYKSGDIFTHFKGLQGELFTACYYGLIEEWARALVWGKGDSGVDLILNGWGCNVKSTKLFTHPWLLVKEYEIQDARHQADVYLLTCVDDVQQSGYVELVGYATFDEVKAGEHPFWPPGADRSNAPSYKLEEYQLRRCRPAPSITPKPA